MNKVGWLQPSAKQHSSHSLTLLFCQVGMKYKEKEKTHGWRHRQFKRRSKSCTCRQSRTRDSPGQAGARPLPRKQGPSTPCLGNTDALRPTAPSASLLELFLLSTVGHLLVQLGSTGPSVSPPSHLPIPIPLTWKAQGGGEAEKASALCKHRSPVAEALVCYQGCFQHKSETQHFLGCSEENELHLSQKQCNEKWKRKWNWDFSFLKLQGAVIF